MSYLVKSPYNNEWSKTFSFVQTDSEELFKRNIKGLGPGWYWKDIPITYKFNKYGYRMNKELEEIDFDNYYAFFGCSFATGVGLPLEETYAYKIAQKANVDYVNAAIGGSSVDFAYINFIELFSKAPKLPKAVIINWPELSRTCFWHNDKIEFYSANATIASYWNDAYNVFLTDQSHIDNRFNTIRQAVQKMCEIANIPLFETSTYQADEHFHITHTGIHRIPLNPDYLSSEVSYYNMVYARDIIIREPNPLAHPGTYFQDRVVEQFFEVMK